MFYTYSRSRYIYQVGSLKAGTCTWCYVEARRAGVIGPQKQKWSCKLKIAQVDGETCFRT